MANSTFFKQIPKGNATADQVLGAGTPMKVITAQGTYVKVELESGDIGFVPEMMVATQAVPSDVPIVPVIDPSIIGPPPVDGEFVAPDPEIPGLETENAPDLSLPDPSEASGLQGPAETAPAPGGVAPEPEIPSLEQENVPPPPVVEGISSPEETSE